MEEKISKIEKIIVNTEDELTDLVRRIHKSDADRIILTFTEQSDILISPVNLKVIQETANKEEKSLIAQIIQNPTGVRNSNLANIKVIETPTRPTEEDWEDAISIRESSKKKNMEQRDTKKEEIHGNNFEARVNSVIDKSRNNNSQSKNNVDDDLITIDNDIKLEETPTLKETSSTGNNQKSHEIPSVKIPLLTNLGNIKKTKLTLDKKYLKLIPKILLPILIIVALSAFAYYKLVPFVKIRVFVEAKPVTLEKIFTGDPNIQDIDFDNLKIPIKTEETTKSLSDSITATGKSYKGDKATGTVTLTYNLGRDCSDADPKISIIVGQSISTSEYNYKATSSAQLTCISPVDIQVQAADIGEEYNIPAGKYFTVQGTNSSQVWGRNSSSFTGGTKKEYTVLSQQDVNTAVEQLSATAIEEVKSELRSKNNGWDIIENTIKSEVDKDSIKTDIPIGAESTTANIQLTIKGTATYYSTKGLNEKLTELLRTEAQKQNLFENNENLDLALGENINKKLSVEEGSTDSSVKIKLIADASVKPNVNKTEIENNLKGKSWGEGLKYIETLSFATQRTEVEFKPDNFPDTLKYFPTKQGGILITVVELQSNKD